MKINRNQQGREGSLSGLLTVILLLCVSALLFASSFRPALARNPSTSPLALGNYPDTSVPLSGDTTVTPNVAPTNTTSITVSTNTNFKGTFTGSPTTGVVIVTDAHPAGTYPVTVTAFGPGGTTTKTFALTVTSTPCGPGLTAGFTNAPNTSVGSSPVSVAIGDFNGDGKQDLAVANFFPFRASIRLGDGLGGFSGSTEVGGANPIYSVAIGDFNGDGKQDLALVQYYDNPGKVLIRLGNGLGGFSGSTEVVVGTYPLSIAIGDFNGDGKQDFAVTNSMSDTTSIRLGDGLGGFSGSTEVSGGFVPYFVAIGDFNADGRQDLAVVNEGSDWVSIHLGDGMGGFSGSTNVGVGFYPTSVAIGDFNGDGNQDLAVTNGSNAVSIRLGDGLGGFSGSTEVSVGSNSYSVAIGDFNGDGKQDLAVANYNSTDKVSIRLGDGLGNFSNATDVNVGFHPRSVAIGDFNGDGRQDLAVVNEGSGTVSSRLGQCINPPTPTPTPACALVITQSTSQAITDTLTPCLNPHPTPPGPTHYDNSYWRAFNMANVAGGDPYYVSAVSFGVSSANNTQPVIVRLYTNAGAPFPGGTRTQIAATTVNVTNAQSGTVVTTPLAATVPAGTSELVMELFTPNGASGGHLFYVGANSAPETGLSYWSGCPPTFPPEPTGVHFVFNVHGGCPATITVTNANDSGLGSLRQALADVPEFGTIEFNHALNGQTITLTSGELVINKSVTITGPGSGLLTVSRDQQATNFRIFHIMPNHTVEISGLTISNGQLQSVNGGGILNDHATLTIIACAISGNVANGFPPAQAGGGGIYNDGTLSLLNSTVTGNSSTGPWSYGGGGIYNAGTLTITQSSINGNSGDTVGGGILNSGMLTMSDSTVSSNHATGFGHGSGYGGGISNGGTLTIQNTTISGNSVAGEAGYGGGISGNSTITNSTISGNTARVGGGISGGGTITNSTISGNSSQYWGGGIYGSVTISNSTISGNTVTGFAGRGISGGGMIRNSTFSGNMPVASAGGGIYGGGIVTNSTVSGNAATQGGGIYANSALQIGNTILKAGGSGANIFNNGGTVTSHGYNLSSDNGGGFLTATGDQINTDPILGPLQNNGGPTFTHALLNGSSAINGGDPNFTPPPSTDQRGYARVYNGRIDIGSFEVQPIPTPSPTPTPGVTPTPTPTPTPCLPMITQSSSQAITTANSASCNDGITHTDNSYWRAFDMNVFANGGQYCINSVSFGVEFANTTQPVTVRLYTTSNFPTGFPGSLTQIGATTVNVGSAQNGTVVTTPLVATVPAGIPQLVMELFTPNGQPGGYRFFVGSNAASESGASYWSAQACGFSTPTTTAAIGFPNMHIVLDVNGTCTCLAPTSPTPTPTLTPSPTPTPCPIFNVTGTVGQCTTTGPSGIALPGVTITRTSSGGDATTITDNAGFYVMSGFSCVTNTLTPSKAALTPGSAGIDTVDVIAIQKHFLIIGAPLTGCRLTAANVNSDGNVNTVDVIATQKFFLGLTSGIANVGTYRFTPASRSYSPPINNQTDQNYDAIVFGDVASPFAH